MSDDIKRDLQRIVMNQEQKPADFIIHKGKGAFQVSLKKGQLSVGTSANGPFPFTRKGCLFLTFANAKGERSYDWDNKVSISLREHEIGDFLLALTKGVPAKFFHDRNMGKPNQGEKTTSVSIKPSDDGKVLLANCFVKNKDEKYSMNPVPIHPNEMVALAELVRASIPHVMGWS